MTLSRFSLFFFQIIKKANSDGTLFSRDWDVEPLFPKPTTEAVTKEYVLSYLPSPIPKLKIASFSLNIEINILLSLDLFWLLHYKSVLLLNLVICFLFGYIICPAAVYQLQLLFLHYQRIREVQVDEPKADGSLYQRRNRLTN